MDSSLLAAVKGSWSFWVIIGCSVVAFAVALERAIALWRFTDRARALADAVTRALYRGDAEDGRVQCERSRSPVADMLLAGLVTAGRRPPGGGATPPEKIAAAVERERQVVGAKLRRGLWILGTVGATAPFIGLFGTVVGIMHAFRQMAESGQGGFAVVAAGISEALVTTAGGIAVAILAVVLYNSLNTHVNRLTLNVKHLAEEFLEVVLERSAEGPPPGAAPAREG